MISLENYLQKHYEKSTLIPRLCAIRKYLNYIGDKALKAHYNDIIAYIAHLRKNENHLHPKTLKQYLGGVKVYYRYLIDTGQRQDHPCSELQLKDKISKQIPVDTLYTTQGLEDYLAGHNKDPKRVRRRNQVITSLLIYQGLSVGEIVQIDLEDIDLEQAQIHIKETQKKKKRTLPLQAKQILLFMHYIQNDRNHLIQEIETTQPITKLITGRYKEELRPNVINELINAHRPKKERITPVKIRQSVIANLLKKENNTRVVQVFAGHRTASTTTLYYQTQLEVLQTAINQYHPIR